MRAIVLGSVTSPITRSCPPTVGTHTDIDIKHPLEPGDPSHRRARGLGGVVTLRGARAGGVPGHDEVTVSGVAPYGHTGASLRRSRASQPRSAFPMGAGAAARRRSSGRCLDRSPRRPAPAATRGGAPSTTGESCAFCRPAKPVHDSPTLRRITNSISATNAEIGLKMRPMESIISA